MEHTLYHYKAKVRSVYDGDTIRADLDLGLNVWIRNEQLRLNRINAPEVRGEEREEGIKSRDYLRDVLAGADEMVVETIQDRKGKYGRYLAEVWVRREDGDWENINDGMVAQGFAVEAQY